MNASAADIVRALVDLSKTLPSGGKLLREVRDLLSREVRGDASVNVALTTPSGDEPALAASVISLLEKKLGKAVQLTQRRNSHLIGGAVVQIGDEQIDLSVRGALNELDLNLRNASLQS